MLCIKDLTVSYSNNPIISDISLTIKPGTLSILMGPNGSGKSTLLYAVLGHPLYAIDNGSILFEEKNLIEMDTEHRAALGLFLATQHAPVLKGVSVLHFLQHMHRSLIGDISLKMLRTEAERLCAIVGLEPSFIMRYVNDGFSGGEKKRFELLQLLLVKPRLALLDEIDSGLDTDGQKKFVALLQQVMHENPHMSILCVTHSHYIALNTHPDSVYILKQGSIIAHGGVSLAHKIHSQGYHGLLL